MAPLHATPVAVVMPHGIDNMVDPPSTVPHSRQPDWLRRHNPSEFVPPTLLSSLALDASRGHQYPTACLTGTRLGDTALLLSAAGPARNLISLTQIPLSVSASLPLPKSNTPFTSTHESIATLHAASLAGLAFSGYRPWYTRANAPLLQLALNFSSLEGWARIADSSFIRKGRNEMMEVPIVAARSASSVEFWKLEQQQEQQQLQQGEEDEEEEEEEEEERFGVAGGAGGDRNNESNKSSNDSTKWKLREESLGIVQLSPSSSLPNSSTTLNSTTTADVAWCHHMTTRCAVLCRNGMLLDVAVEDGAGSKNKITTQGHNSTTNYNNKRNKNKIYIQSPMGWAPSSQLLSELPFLEETVSPSSTCLRCAFTDNHPRHVVVSLHNRLGLVDLHGGSGGGGGSSSSANGGFSDGFSGYNSCYRSGFSQEVYRCPPGQWISALSTPCFNGMASGAAAATSSSSASPFPSSCSHYVAASTATEILLFDLRRPHAVLASWEHSMTAEGKVKDVAALYAAPPDTLTWLPPAQSSAGRRRNREDVDNDGDRPGRGGRGTARGGASTSAAAAAGSVASYPEISLDYNYQVVASNAYHGKAIVCEWNEHHTRGGIAAAKKGKLWEYPLSKISKLTSMRKNLETGATNAKEAEEDYDDDDDELEEAEFSFEPTCWTEIKPEQPPKLLFNLKNGYPASLAAAVERGKEMQRNRATVAATGGPTLRTARRSREEGQVEEQPRGENVPLQQQQEQHPQQQRQQRAVRLLPSHFDGPASLGIAIIPLQQDWKRNDGKNSSNPTYTAIPEGTLGNEDGGGGEGGGGSGETAEALFALLSSTQEVILAQLGGNSNFPNSSNKTTPSHKIASTSAAAATTNAITALNAPVMKILNPVKPEHMKVIDPGGVVEIRLDSQGRIMEDPQVQLAKEAAAGAVGTMVPGVASLTTIAAVVAAVERSSNVSMPYPQFKIKQPVFVGLSLHKWMLEEAVRQYEMSDEEYQATFPFPSPKEDETEEEMRIRKKLMLTSARVPFTAGEAFTALTSQTSNERISTLFQGTTPSIAGGSKKKKTTTASGSGGGGGATAEKQVDPLVETFTAALARAGIIPLPPHIRCIPGKESNSTGLSALQSRAPFFPPMPSFTSYITTTNSTNDDIRSDNDGDNDGIGVEIPPNLHVSTLKYKKRQIRAFATEPVGVAVSETAVVGGGRSELGLPAPEIASETDAKGHNVVFRPVVQGSGAEHGVFGDLSVPGRPPTAAAQTVLDELKQQWTAGIHTMGAGV